MIQPSSDWIDRAPRRAGYFLDHVVFGHDWRQARTDGCRPKVSRNGMLGSGMADSCDASECEDDSSPRFDGWRAHDVPAR